MQVKKPQLELDMEQQTGFKLGKEHMKAVYYHPVYLTYMQSSPCEMLGRMKHKLESRLLGNGNPLQYSCLGNPMDRGAWRATVHGVTTVRQIGRAHV